MGVCFLYRLVFVPPRKSAGKLPAGVAKQNSQKAVTGSSLSKERGCGCANGASVRL